MNSTLFRALQADDLPAVAHIEQHVHANPWTSTQILEVANLLGNQYLGFVLQDTEAQVNAYIIFQKLIDEVEILTVGVDKDAQGQGLGCQLLQQSLQALTTRFPDLTACFLEVRISNAAARALYARTNFVEVGRRKNYYLDSVTHEREDALILRHDFGTHINKDTL